MVYIQIWASLVTQLVKNLPAMQEIQVWSLSRDDPLEEGMATHSSSLAWRVPWTEEPGGLQSLRSHRVRHDWSDSATAANPHWHHDRSKSTVNLGVHSWCSVFCAKWHVSITLVLQSIFTALKILYALPIHSFCPPPPPQPLIFYCFHSFDFSRMSSSWNHTVCSFFRLYYFTQ